MILTSTLRDTKLAVGLFGCIRSYGSVLPTEIAQFITSIMIVDATHSRLQSE